MPFVLLLALIGGAAPSDDLALRARAVLETYCLRCHGPSNESPKAVRDWSDASDLALTIEDGLVFAGEPENSDLWLVIEEGSMPPADAPEGAVPAAEAELVKRWIEAGAVVPDPLPEPAPEPASAASSQSQPAGSATPPVGSSSFPVPPPQTSVSEVDPGSPLGRLHPLVVHFPIALLTVAFLAELLSLVRLGKHRGTVRFCLWVGVLGAAAASWLGWALGDLQPRSGSSGQLMERHRWYAVATLAVATLGLIATEIRARRSKPGAIGTLAPLLLLLGTLLVSWTGHLGGKLSYGVDWLDATLPQQIEGALDWLEERLP